MKTFSSPLQTFLFLAIAFLDVSCGDSHDPLRRQDPSNGSNAGSGNSPGVPEKSDAPVENASSPNSSTPAIPNSDPANTNIVAPAVVSTSVTKPNCPPGFQEIRREGKPFLCEVSLPKFKGTVSEPSCKVSLERKSGSIGILLHDKKIQCPKDFRASEIDTGKYCTIDIPEEFQKNLRTDCSRYFSESKLAFYYEELPKVPECPFEMMEFKGSNCRLKVDLTNSGAVEVGPYCDYWKDGYFGFWYDYDESRVLTGASLTPCPKPFKEGYVWQSNSRSLTQYCTLSDEKLSKQMKKVTCDVKTGEFVLYLR